MSTRAEAALIEPARVAVAFVRLYLEVECGRRPAAQLAGVMTPRAYAQLCVRGRPSGPLGRIRSVRGVGSGPDRHDVVVLVERGPRVGAIALQLGRQGPGWVVLEALRPEDADNGRPAEVAGLVSS